MYYIALLQYVVSTVQLWQGNVKLFLNRVS